MDREDRWLLAALVLAIVLLIGGSVLWNAWPKKYRLIHPAQIASVEQLSTEFVDGSNVYELIVTPAGGDLPLGGGGELDLVEPWTLDIVTPTPKPTSAILKRLVLKCNGRVIFDAAPTMPLDVGFDSVGLQAPQGEGEGARKCAEMVVIMLQPSAAAVREGRLTTFFLTADEREVVPSNFLYDKVSLPARRIRARVTANDEGALADFTIDLRLAEGRLKTVSFNCGDPTPVIQVDRPAPKGAFGIEVTVNADQRGGRCGGSAVELLGSDVHKTRTYAFDEGRRFVRDWNPDSLFRRHGFTF